MFGAILGDIIGSPYEFDMGNKSKDFPLFRDGMAGTNDADGTNGTGGGDGTDAAGTTDGAGYRNSGFTDDTVMTIAVADGLKMASRESFNDENVKKCITEALIYWGKKYPDAGYGARFDAWLNSDDHQPYNSFGNGSAMRVSSVGWIANSIDSARRLARASAEVTHNHPEGIKGAEAVASAIFMSRANCTKEDIKTYIVDQFGYDLSRTCDEIRPDYHHVESCQETVPEAITAFLEGEDFEDVIRTAVSLGGDCDTLTAIAGSIAEAYYGIPAELKYECYKRLDEDLGTILSQFERSFQFNESTACKYHPIYWFSRDEEGFVQLERPYAKPKKMTRKLDGFDTSAQALDGVRRANLYLSSFGVWDIAAFSAWMDATYGYGPLVDGEGRKYTMTFTTPQAADSSVYPFLSKEAVERARANVETFYADPMLQLEWADFILHPVAVKVTDKGEAIPVPMSEIDRAQIELAQQEIFDFRKLKDMKSNVICFYHEYDDYGCFSNWYRADFEYAGRRYTSVEQYMMYQKVAMFGAWELAERIMATDDPAEIKKLGRSEISAFDSEVWDKTCYTIVKRGVFAKFNQNPQLAEILLSTGNKVLAEASANDRKWGIGVDCCDDVRFKVSGWRGQNLLGRALMEVRAELRTAQLAAQCRPADEPATLEYIDLKDVDFPEWHMTAGELRCIPQFHNAIHAYSDTLDSRSLRDSFLYEHSLCEWEEILRGEMTAEEMSAGEMAKVQTAPRAETMAGVMPEVKAKSLPAAGFWEMKQEVWEMVKGH
ncbi:MAG: NADAR domain-containing protein [Emergencia sp.]